MDCEKVRRILVLPHSETTTPEVQEALKHLLECNACFVWSMLESEKLRQGVPMKQLEDRHYERWDGVNVQEFATEPPEEEQNTLALYMVDIETQTSKRFTVTASLTQLLQRKTTHVAYGTSKPNGEQVKIVIQWEKEIRR